MFDEMIVTWVINGSCLVMKKYVEVYNFRKNGGHAEEG